MLNEESNTSTNSTVGGPSILHYIYEHSQSQSDILNNLTDYPKKYGTSLDTFQTEIFDTIETAASTEAGPE